MNEKDWAVEVSSGELNSPYPSNYTFYGVCSQYPEACFSGTKEKTRSEYRNHLRNTILPAIEDHNSKNIAEYTREDYDKVIGRIRDRGTLTGCKKGVFEPYEESTIQKFRVIIYRIAEVAANYNLCKNVLADTIFCLSENDLEKILENRKTLFMTKKSVTPAQEVALMNELLGDPCCGDGRQAAGVVVVVCGARPNEAAAATFGNIKELPSHPGVFCLYVPESTELKSSDVKLSGKTGNANRPLILSDRALAFLLKRKAFVDRELTARGIEHDIDHVHIGCMGRDYLSCCSSEDVSNGLKAAFAKVGIKKKLLAVIDAELTYGEQLEIEERSASGYLGRHIFATMLGVLDLDETDIQFIIGHKIEDPEVRRSDLTSEDNLVRLKRELNKIPSLSLRREEAPADYVVTAPCSQWEGEGRLNGSFHSAKRIYLTVRTKESFDDLSLEISAPGATIRAIPFSERSGETPRRVDIRQDYEEVFRKVEDEKSNVTRSVTLKTRRKRT